MRKRTATTGSADGSSPVHLVLAFSRTRPLSNVSSPNLLSLRDGTSNLFRYSFSWLRVCVDCSIGLLRDGERNPRSVGRTVPLPDDMRHLDLRFECPNCNHPIIRKGSWFRVISTFRCEQCGAPLRLGYGDKLDLFEKHKHLRPTNSADRPGHQRHGRRDVR